MRLRVVDVSLMRRYFNDWRFVLNQIGSSTALLHLEPDFCAYAQFLAVDPRLLPAAVASANPTDCGHLPNSVAGMGRCLISMARKYAPNAKVCSQAGRGRRVPQGGRTLRAPAWLTSLGLPSAAFPLLSSPTPCPQPCPYFSYAH